MTNLENIGSFILKILYAVIINVFFFISAFLISNYVDKKIVGTFVIENENKKTTIRLLLECGIHISLLIIYLFITIHILKHLYYPIIIKHHKTHWDYTDIIIPQFYVAIIISYQRNLLQKLNILRRRVI